MNGHPKSAQLDSKSFEAIAELMYRECGLQLVAEKSSMIQSRLRHRLKAVGAQSFDAYATLVCSNQGQAERIEMISALTTNVSHFFREKHHFDILKNEILPNAINSLGISRGVHARSGSLPRARPPAPARIRRRNRVREGPDGGVAGNPGAGNLRGTVVPSRAGIPGLPRSWSLSILRATSSLPGGNRVITHRFPARVFESRLSQRIVG